MKKVDNKKRDRAGVLFRPSPETRDWLTALAAKNGRSVAMTLEKLLDVLREFPAPGPEADGWEAHLLRELVALGLIDEAWLFVAAIEEKSTLQYHLDLRSKERSKGKTPRVS